ncbi:MAG TPA: hypothetical protein GXX46_06650 [Peptococcaceae bacterium]|nr:hypothetical protein [Peptococcaceae bacterium]
MSKKILSCILVTFLILTLTIAGCSSAPSGNAPQEKENPPYPEKQIDIIVPFAAGGGLDLVGRAIAEYMTKEWGQAVNVINKPGAAGAIGNTEALKGSKPDGYTALIAGLNNSSAL